MSLDVLKSMVEEIQKPMDIAAIKNRVKETCDRTTASLLFADEPTYKNLRDGLNEEEKRLREDPDFLERKVNDEVAFLAEEKRKLLQKAGLLAQELGIPLSEIM